MRALDKLKIARHFLFESGIIDADRDAELIISHCLGIKRLHLYKDNPEITKKVLIQIDGILKRRARREPLQYIIGYTEFCGLKIKVGPGVLIPRPETELLVEEAIKLVKSYKLKVTSQNSCFKFLDLCTGTGCIALSLAKEFQDADGYATDISEIAIRYSEENAKINGIKNVTFLKGSLFEPIKNIFTADLIISNPPYIKRSDLKNLQPEIKDWEPVDALDGGEDGLDYYRLIIPESVNYIKNQGFLMLEIGINQSDEIKKIAENAGFQNVKIVKDFAGIERIIILDKE